MGQASNSLPQLLYIGSKGETMNTSDLPHKSIHSANLSWHKYRHTTLHRALLEIVKDYIDITHRPIDRITALELVTWSDEQQRNPSFEED